MFRWQIIIMLAAFTAAGSIATTLAGPQDIINAIIYSPPGQVLLGRVAAAYTFIYTTTKNSFISLAAGILLANTATISIVLVAPAALHASHTLVLRSRRGSRWLIGAGWELPQLVMLFISFYLAGFTGLSIGVVAATKSPTVFMIPEGTYVALTSSTIYAASKLHYADFMPRYGSMLRKTVPVIIALMVISAVVEAYEIL